MASRFDSFVLFAEMRTGSNFLEENLNLFPELSCLGEVFNPHFVAYPHVNELWGTDLAARDADPLALLKSIREAKGVAGFRYFHDHHPAVLDTILKDPRCAKVVLTRNPVDSYVSWKIARSTGQWKLTNATNRKSTRAYFDRREFETQLSHVQGFQLRIQRALQTTGQTAFYIGYDDIRDLDVVNGLAHFLGSDTTLDQLSKNLKIQNPAHLSEKVENYEEMERALASLDKFDLGRTPNFEPRRGPLIPTYIAGARAPLLFMPIRSGPTQQVKEWLAALDGVAPRDLTYDFGQKQLRQWKRQRPGHRSFTVVSHPLERAYRTFTNHIVGTGEGSYLEIRKTLMRVFNVPLDADGPGPSWSADDQRAAFLGFLKFLKLNLSGQTGVRVDASWATQVAVLQGFAEFAHPDAVVREANLGMELHILAAQVGLEAPRSATQSDEDGVALSDIYDPELEAAARDVYQRDYMTFGFGPWEG